VNDNLQKIRTLTVQAKNGTNTDSDKQSIQDEIKQRLAEIDRISEQTEFNGIKVLSKDQSLSIQVGADDKQTIDIELKKMDSAELKMDDYDVTGADTDTLLATVDAALSTVSSLRSGLGAVQNRFDSVVNTLNSTVVNLTASQSRIQDADMATEVSNMSKGNMLQQAGTAVLAQANQSPQNILSLLR